MDTVLIIDDEPSNIKILQEALKSTYRILVATGGSKALSLLDSQSPDLILLDIVMPEMDGYETCRQIKARTDTAEIPVLFVSAQDRVEDKTRGFEAGGMDYITKPYEIPEVLVRVKTHIELYKARKFQDEVDRITRHDLKAPLQAMLGLPDLMLYDENLNEEQLENLGLIKDSARKMLGMINLGLDIFRMEMNMYHLDAETLDLNSLLELMVLERLRTDDSVPIVLSSENDCVVEGEELLLYSMFNNLIQNAWEASEAGEQIDLCLEAAEESVRVTISNSGVVPEAIRDDFFGKYVSSGKSGGTGLGTYSARLIVKAHSGEITLDTDEPGRTSVIVTLPRKH